ncbi:MAG: hypothetical protein LUG98_03810 [Tannerellaceae bacterium]|nr:hypothetical protein [Tannerellaceae bacterium]
MKTKEQLAKELETTQGWKSILGGWFKGYRAGKKCREYTSADWKGVADLHILRRETHEDFYYAVGAFSTSAPLTEEQLAVLKERIDEFPINQIRYESVGTGGFYLHVTDEGEYFMEGYALHAQAEDMEDVYVVVFSDDKKKALRCPYIVYKHQEGGLYINFVDEKYLIS